VQVTSLSHRQEIALKQVSYPIYLILYHSYLTPTNSFFSSGFQEQDSPNSLFYFAIDISDDEGEEASSSLALGIASAEIKSKLEDLLALLQQDTTHLVDDSDPAKAIFKSLHGQIPADAEEMLFQATHQESHQL